MTVAVIPVRSFRDGMKRLSQVLTPAQRSDLGRLVAERVVTTVLDSGVEVFVVTADVEVGNWATRHGCAVVDDPGLGLNAAVSMGVNRAAGPGTRCLILHADLPLFDADDLEMLQAGIATGADVIAPSVGGGTSALSAARALEFSYGEGSFLRHLPMLTDPSVVVTDGLLQDLDTPDDLKAVTEHPRGRWLEGYIESGKAS